VHLGDERDYDLDLSLTLGDFRLRLDRGLFCGVRAFAFVSVSGGLGGGWLFGGNGFSRGRRSGIVPGVHIYEFLVCGARTFVSGSFALVSGAFAFVSGSGGSFPGIGGVVPGGCALVGRTFVSGAFAFVSRALAFSGSRISGRGFVPSGALVSGCCCLVTRALVSGSFAFSSALTFVSGSGGLVCGARAFASGVRAFAFALVSGCRFVPGCCALVSSALIAFSGTFVPGRCAFVARAFVSGVRALVSTSDFVFDSGFARRYCSSSSGLINDVVSGSFGCSFRRHGVTSPLLVIGQMPPHLRRYSLASVQSY
jgi:hypothetical protein